MLGPQLKRDLKRATLHCFLILTLELITPQLVIGR